MKTLTLGLGLSMAALAADSHALSLTDRRTRIDDHLQRNIVLNLSSYS